MNDNIKEIAKIMGFTREVNKMQWSGESRISFTEKLCDVIGTLSAQLPLYSQS